MSPQPITNADRDSVDPKDNRFIRTYAKDYARVAGTEAATTPEKKKRGKSLFGAKKSHDKEELIAAAVDTASQQAPSAELTQQERDAEIRDQRAMRAESELSKEISDSATEPLSNFTDHNFFGSGPTQNPATPNPTDEAIDASRESILQRLREKALTSEKDQTPAQTFEPILPQKIEAPSTLPEQKPAEPVFVPPPAPEPIPQPAPEPATEPAPFHSFSTDFADRVDTQHASTFSVLAAQGDAAPLPPSSAPKRTRSFLPIAAGILLIMGSAVGVLAAFHFMQQHTPVLVTTGVPSLITPDTTIQLNGTDYTQALAQAASNQLNDGQIAVTYIKSASTTAQGSEQVPQPGGVLFGMLQIGAPDILTRNIDPSSTIGIIHAGSETRPFFLLRTNSYDRTFVGMLNWETTMQRDMNMLYPLYTDQSVSTTSLAAPQLPTQFTDDVVASHSVRVLRDSQGRSLILYGYTADKQTLIVARDENAFTLLLNRLAASGK